jgi:hypothetical protein
MVKGLTPYQGRKRTFGIFLCDECLRAWSSPHSWSNTPQACLECNAWVYPYSQFQKKRKRKRKNKMPDKEHIQKLCGRCCSNINSCSVK